MLAARPLAQARGSQQHERKRLDVTVTDRSMSVKTRRRRGAI